MISKNIWFCLKLQGRLKLSVFIGLSLFNAIAEMLGIGLVIPLIGILLNPHFLNRYPAFDFITQRFTGHQIVLIAIAGTILFYLVKNIMSYFALRYQFRMLYDTYELVSNALYTKFTYAKRETTEKYTQASLQNLVQALPLAMAISVLVPVVILMIECVMILLVGGLLFAYNFVSAALIFLVFGGIALLFYWHVKRRVAHFGAMAQEKSIVMTQLLNDSKSLITEIQLYNRVGSWLERFKDAAASVGAANFVVTFFNQVPKQIIESIGVMVVLGVLLIGFIAGASTHWLLINITVFGAAAMRLMPSVNRIMSSLVLIKSYGFVADKISGVLRDDAQQIILQPLSEVANDYRGPVLEAQAISFCYPKTDKVIFENESFTVPQGALVSLVGASGAGKSTLMDLMMGFLEPTSGKLLFQGHSISGLLGKGVAYLPQNVHLLSGTVRDNIAFGREVDDQQIWDALTSADIADFVRGLPECLNTPIGESGVTVSGGQRQRLGIARALCQSPKILFLDEPTASLDMQSTQQILETIEHLRGSVTMLLVTHDIEQARLADQLLFLSTDHTLLQGTYEELKQHSVFNAFIAKRHDRRQKH